VSEYLDYIYIYVWLSDIGNWQQTKYTLLKQYQCWLLVDRTLYYILI